MPTPANVVAQMDEHRRLASGRQFLLDTTGRICHTRCMSNSNSTSTVTSSIAGLPGDEYWDDVEIVQCECELDWNCGLHESRLYTAIELINDEWSKTVHGDPHVHGF
jgi:hypothetical protein